MATLIPFIFLEKLIKDLFFKAENSKLLKILKFLDVCTRWDARHHYYLYHHDCLREKGPLPKKGGKYDICHNSSSLYNTFTCFLNESRLAKGGILKKTPSILGINQIGGGHAQQIDFDFPWHALEGLQSILSTAFLKAGTHRCLIDHHDRPNLLQPSSPVLWNHCQKHNKYNQLALIWWYLPHLC